MPYKDPDKAREHARGRAAAWRKRNPEPAQKTQRKHRLKKQYGLTLEEYQERYNNQRGCCAICGKAVEKLHVDHCHTTGRVRGLLCTQCNVMLGMAQDNPDTLRAGAEYLAGG